MGQKQIETELEPKAYEVEHHKAVVDYFKHLTSLSTGSIVLITAFLEKLFQQPKMKSLVIISISSFMISVLGAVIMLTLLLRSSPGTKIETGRGEDLLGNLSLIATWLGFLLGLIALTVFSIANLL